MKMKQTLALLTFGGAMLMLAACGSDVKMSGDASERKTAKAVIRVVNNLTSQPLDSAKVLLQGQKSPVAVDANGIASFSDLDAGTYTVQVVRNGYASRIASFNISSNVDQRVEMQDVSVPVRLPKIGQKKSGSVYVIDANGNQVAAKGANLFIDLGADTYMKSLYTTTADDSGKYSFDSLPEGVQMYVGMYEYTLNGSQFPRVSAIAVVPATPLTNTLAVTTSVVERSQDSLIVIVDGKALTTGSIANLVVDVTDHLTGQPVAGVSVVLEGTTKTATTDAVGQAMFTGVEQSRYTVRVKKDSTYANVRLQANCVNSSVTTSSSIQTCEYKVYLPKIGVKLSGSVHYDSLGSVRAAANVPVNIDLSAVAASLGTSGALGDGVVSWVTPTITTTTDANGAFSFSGLPEGIAVSAKNAQFQRGQLLYVSATVAGYASTTRVEDQLLPGTAVALAPTFTEGSLAVIASDSLTTDHDTISVTFNLALNTSKVTTKINGSELIYQSWSTDGKSVRLIPLSGKWAPLPAANSIDFTTITTQAGQTSGNIPLSRKVNEPILALVKENNTDSLDSNSEVALYTFSTGLDSAKTFVHVYSTNLAGNPEILVNTTYSSDHKTVQILPQSGHWDVTDKYFAVINGTTKNNQVVAISIGSVAAAGIEVFKAQKTPKAITALNVVGYSFNTATNVSTAHLKWTSSDTVMAYEGFGAIGTNPFVSLGDFQTTRFDTTADYALTLAGVDVADPRKVDAMSIMIKARNDYGIATHLYGVASPTVSLAPSATSPATVVITQSTNGVDNKTTDVTVTATAGASEDYYIIRVFAVNPDGSLATGSPVYTADQVVVAPATTPISFTVPPQTSGTHLKTFVRPIKRQTVAGYDAVIGNWQSAATYYAVP